jgi:hypothetical protein
MLAELREYLPLMGRVLKSDAERRRYQDMLRLWDRENTRVEQAYTQPVAQVSALGALQKNWLRRHSGQPLDMRRSLVLVLEHFEDVVLRITIPAFTVRDGVLLNPTSPYAYSLLLAPAWYAHFLPSCFDGAKIGLADTALITKVDVDDLKDDAIEAMLSLWCEDMSSDYFQLNQLRDAVQDLLALG